ncbi:uncharacterized protein RDI95_011751 [Morus bassanus]
MEPLGSRQGHTATLAIQAAVGSRLWDRTNVKGLLKRGRQDKAKVGADLLEAFSSLGSGPGQAFGEMFSLPGCSLVRSRLDNHRSMLTAPRTSGMSRPGSTSMGKTGADGTRCPGLRGAHAVLASVSLVLASISSGRGPPAEKRNIPKSPRPAGTPQKSPDTDTGAAEPEQAAGATPVKLEARQKPVDSHSQDPSAMETDPEPPEEGSARTGDCLEVEPCSQSVPKAGAGGGSHPDSPTAPPEPAERVHMAASSAGEVGAELCPSSQGQQHLPSGAGEVEAEATHDGLLSGLQPSENSQVPSGATAEPDAQPNQACSDTCATPETSPGTQHPPGSGETEPAVGGGHQLCSALPMSSPADTDLRSAAILARKEEIELSYQQFSLTIAVVATMLLQKEPSMEAALGLALRANLRQGWIHHLQELEDFIDSYDSATLSH